MNFYGDLITSKGSLPGRQKSSSVESFTIACHTSSPFLPFQVDSFISTLIGFLSNAILCVLARCTFSKILSAVIKSIPIFVISKFSLLAIKDSSLHINKWVTAAHRIIAAVVFIPIGRPIPFIQPFKVGSIYDSFLSFCKWDNAVRLVLRLGDFVPLHAVLSFIHVPTLDRNLKPASILPQVRYVS
jgi:hypothetical protein